MTDDKKTIFLGLSVSERPPAPAAARSSSLSIPVTLGEWEVLRALFAFIIPRALAFDAAFAPREVPRDG